MSIYSDKQFNRLPVSCHNTGSRHRLKYPCIAKKDETGAPGVRHVFVNALQYPLYPSLMTGIIKGCRVGMDIISVTYNRLMSVSCTVHKKDMTSIV